MEVKKMSRTNSLGQTDANMTTLKATEELFSAVMKSLVLNDSKSLHEMNAAMAQGCEVQLLITVKPKGTV